MTDPAQLQMLYRLAHQIRSVTAFAQTHDIPEDVLPTAAELAKQLGLNHERVKKSLKVLKDLGLIRALGLNPKRFRFDSYHYQTLLNTADLSENDLLDHLLHRLHHGDAELMTNPPD